MGRFWVNMGRASVEFSGHAAKRVLGLCRLFKNHKNKRQKLQKKRREGRIFNTKTSLEIAIASWANQNPKPGSKLAGPNAKQAKNNKCGNRHEAFQSWRDRIWDQGWKSLAQFGPHQSQPFRDRLRTRWMKYDPSAMTTGEYHILTV